MGGGVWFIGFTIVLLRLFRGLSGRPHSRWAAETAPPTTSSLRRETLSSCPCLDLSRRLSWGFQRCPSIGLGARRPLLLGSASALAPAPPRFGLLSPGSRSRSVFVVSHHHDGFLRRASCGFVAPRSRSWGSPRCGRSRLGAEAPPRSRPSATLHPSKLLHARSSPPCLHGSPGLLPSCRSPILLTLASEGGSTPGLFSTGRVHGLPRALRPWVPYRFLGFLLLSVSSFRAPDRRSRGRRLSWGDPTIPTGEPRRSRRSVLLPASPPRGGGALAFCSIEDRSTRDRSLSWASPGPPR
jgi:hypothetical protein